MNQLAIKEEFNLEKFAQEVEVMTRVSKQLLATKHYMTLGEAGIFAILQRAKALNVEPFSALNGGLYYISGKVGMSTELMVSLVRRAGHSISKDEKSDDKICILYAKRADTGDTWTCKFTMEDARKAGIDKHMYAKYPAVMLYNRCMSMLCRQFFADVIGGAGYERDELEEIRESKGLPKQEPVLIEVEEVKEIPAENIVTQEMVDSLCNLLKKDVEFREKVENFVLKDLGKNSFLEISYKDFSRIQKQTIKHFNEKEKNGSGNKEATSEIPGEIQK